MKFLFEFVKKHSTVMVYPDNEFLPIPIGVSLCLESIPGSVEFGKNTFIPSQNMPLLRSFFRGLNCDFQKNVSIPEKYRYPYIGLTEEKCEPKYSGQKFRFEIALPAALSNVDINLGFQSFGKLSSDLNPLCCQLGLDVPCDRLIALVKIIHKQFGCIYIDLPEENVLKQDVFYYPSQSGLPFKELLRNHLKPKENEPTVPLLGVPESYQLALLGSTNKKA